MKKIIAFMLLISLIFSFCSCKKKKTIEFVSGEILEADGKYQVNYTLRNNTGEKISSLTVTIKTYRGEEPSEEKNASYPIDIESGAEATVNCSVDQKCDKAEIVSFSYNNEKGKTVTGTFDGDCSVYPGKESEESTALTREKLAEEIIEESRNEFLKKRTYSIGSYDSEAQRLYIASRHGNTYQQCLEDYKKDPSAWDDLQQGVVAMSNSYLQRFRDNGFNDVSVSVGVMSYDEEIMFAATDGKLTDTLDNNNQ